MRTVWLTCSCPTCDDPAHEPVPTHLDPLFPSTDTTPASPVLPDMLVCCVPQAAPFTPGPALLAMAPWLARAEHSAGLADVHGKAGELTILYGPPQANVPRLCLVGVGVVAARSADEAAPPVPGALPQATADLLRRVRRAMAQAQLKARTLGLVHVGLLMDSLPHAPACCSPASACCSPAPLPSLLEAELEEAVCAALLGLYRYTALKTASADNADELRPDPSLFSVCTCLPHVTTKALRAAALRGTHAAHAVQLARDLVNAPANILGPAELVAQACRTAAQTGLRCTVLDGPELTRQSMGAFMAVAQGSAREPALVCLEHAPAGHEQEQPLVLVGKGLCFDSGGISLKPSAGMHEMKGDMGGAAAVLGTLMLVAQLGLPRRVVGLLACAENMPDALATRPGDTVTTMSGKTVEILNTDAEGRLVLCDALTYAQRQWQPAALIDVATLTGACVVALGNETGGLFTGDGALATALQQAGQAVGEALWPMPVWDSYAEGLKSETADLANIGSREGGAITAALFLKQFVEPGVCWAHLDIAGPAFMSKKSNDLPAGGTGFALRTLTEWIRRASSGA